MKGYNKISDRALRKLVSAIASEAGGVSYAEVDAQVKDTGHRLQVTVKLALPTRSLEQVLSAGPSEPSLGAKIREVGQSVTTRTVELSGRDVETVHIEVPSVNIRTRRALL